ncbi:hypothetical protein Tco_0366256 [Tanacetum coccineum]
MPTTLTIPPIITTTTTQLQYHFLPSPPKSSSQPEGELIKKDKGKEVMSSMDVEEEKTESDSGDDSINLTGSIVESSKKKKLKKFDFVTEQEVELRKEEWIDLLGVDVVTKYYKAKLQYDKYCDKMLNRRVQSRITNCDYLTRKGPITLKVYREDGTDKVILNFKVSDLHLSEWREVVRACPNKKGAGWSTIYEQIQTRMDYLHKTEAELEIDLDKPLGEQDRLDRLNDLARKKRKHVDDIHDLFRSTKKFKSYVQCGYQPAGTMLNKLILGMILFNSFHRQDFVTIEDFEDFPNEMLYTVQEIFFRLHQGLGLDDHARTFSSLLLVEVGKRNMNPLKQMRANEQLR